MGTIIRRNTKVILISIGILAVFFSLWLVYFVFLLSPSALSAPADAGNGQVFNDHIVTGVDAEPGNPFLIAKGDGLRQIADSLSQRGIVRSAGAFKFYSFVSGNAHQLKPGVYNISPASSTPQIVRLLVAGPATDIAVLIREGERLDQIDELLSRIGVIKKGALIGLALESLKTEFGFLNGEKTLEGYLFPDTYRFFFDSNPLAVAKIFLENFRDKALPVISTAKKNIHDIVTIASMIEKEVPGSADRRLVSGIIYRRLAISMPLQIDATVAYAKLHGDRYDTYKYYGLPPGPISNPGLDAIKAALEPKKSAFLYYLSDPKTDKTIFSKTFEEHDNNRAKYLRGGQ